MGYWKYVNDKPKGGSGGGRGRGGRGSQHGGGHGQGQAVGRTQEQVIQVRNTKFYCFLHF
jgi:hypothetical protein